MNQPPPSAYHPQLSVERLSLIAGWLLDELYATEDDLARDTDNRYTRGCTAFMRQRVRILKEAASGKHPWLTVPGGGNDLVFAIEGVPCRYSNDDPDNPKKDAVTTANQYQASFFDPADDERPSRFCFVIDRGFEGLTEPHVELLGFTASNTVACRWVSSGVRTLHTVNEQPLTPAVPIDKPVVALKRQDAQAEGDDANVAGEP